MSQIVQFCSFRLDGQLFGVAVERVQEVLRQLDMTPVPLARRDICGLINLRGQIVTAIDLRRRLELPDRLAGDRTPMNVVVRAADELVSFLVDEIAEVIEVDLENLDEPPPTLDGVARELIRGAYKLPGRLLLLLDLERTMCVGA